MIFRSPMIFPTLHLHFNRAKHLPEADLRGKQEYSNFEAADLEK
jgi:hypothetical protein